MITNASAGIKSDGPAGIKFEALHVPVRSNVIKAAEGVWNAHGLEPVLISRFAGMSICKLDGKNPALPDVIMIYSLAGSERPLSLHASIKIPNILGHVVLMEEDEVVDASI
jgi:hypothetical protein